MFGYAKTDLLGFFPRKRKYGLFIVLLYFYLSHQVNDSSIRSIMLPGTSLLEKHDSFYLYEVGSPTDKSGQEIMTELRRDFLNSKEVN